MHGFAPFTNYSPRGEPQSALHSCCRFMISPPLRRLVRASQNGSRILRSWLYAKLFQECGDGLRVFGRISVQHPELIRLGRGCTLNEGCVLLARAPITIGNLTHISPGVIITSAQLSKTPDSDGDRRHTCRDIQIGNGVWIGSGAIVLPGVRIGDGAIVGAGAVVSRNIEAWTVALGIPAKAHATVDPRDESVSDLSRGNALS